MKKKLLLAIFILGGVLFLSRNYLITIFITQYLEKNFGLNCQIERVSFDFSQVDIKNFSLKKKAFELEFKELSLNFNNFLSVTQGFNIEDIKDLSILHLNLQKNQ